MVFDKKKLEFMLEAQSASLDDVFKWVVEICRDIITDAEGRSNTSWDDVANFTCHFRNLENCLVKMNNALALKRSLEVMCHAFSEEDGFDLMRLDDDGRVFPCDMHFATREEIAEHVGSLADVKSGDRTCKAERSAERCARQKFFKEGHAVVNGVHYAMYDCKEHRIYGKEVN